MKIFNRGVRVNVKNEDALVVNGVVIIDKDGKIYGDIHASAGSIGATELATDAVETAKIKNAAVTAAKLATDSVENAKIKDGAVTLAKLASTISSSHVIKFFVLGSTVTGVTLTGLLTDDMVISILADGTVTVATCVADNTLPADPADTTYILVLRATA